VLDTLTGFVAMLREAGLPISLTEAIDAADAVRCVPLEDRQAVKYALGATLVKSSTHWKAFDTAFEVYFSLRPFDRPGDGTEGGDGGEQDGPFRLDQTSGQVSGGSLDSISAEQLAAMLYKALLEGDEALLEAIARIAVDRFAGMEPGRPVGGVYYLYRTLRNLDLDNTLARLMDAARAEGPPDEAAGVGGDFGYLPPGTGPGGQGLTPLEERLLREEYKARIELLRQEIEAEIRRRLVADRGPQALARSLRRALPEDVEFMHASRDELVVMRRAVFPLARKLAARLARRRRKGKRGPLDFRSTIRHSLAYGGVPADPRFRRPRPSKPEIFVIADISGSVSAFARFTLHLVHAIGSQFSNVRSFAFIDGIDEVTSMFDRSETIAEAIHKVNTEADVVWVDGHSDYGHALMVFWERWGRDITPRTSILLLGDARNNYHATQSHVLAEMRRRARHVYWLNPEPRNYWGSGDSVINHYAQFCDGVYECRNLRQLEAFVEKLG
jgi:uncharacterized protein with von Willebrand factor type A (vWA) domain